MAANSRGLLANYDIVEILIGFIVTVVAIALLVVFYTSKTTAGVTGYELSANLPASDGLNVGSDVRIAGIGVGKVSRLDLNAVSYLATAHIIIKDSVRVPVDSSISCPGDIISGSVHLEIVPGKSKSLMRHGDVIRKAQGCASDLKSTIQNQLPH